MSVETVANAQSVIFNNPLTAVLPQPPGGGAQSGFELGMDFTVNSPVTVTALGTYDNNLIASGATSPTTPATTAQITASLSSTYWSSGDPFQVQVAIYQVNANGTGTLVSPIAIFGDQNLGNGLSGGPLGTYFSTGLTASAGSIYESIPNLSLTPGVTYSIVATGYVFGFPSGNTVLIPPSPTPTFNTLSGELTISPTGARYNSGVGQSPISFPTGTVGVAEAGDSPDFLAGTFIAFAPAGSPTIPDGGVTITLLGVALTGMEGLRRKFRR